MIVKINWMLKFQWLWILLLFCASCQPELTEDEKFERFVAQYEKTVVKIFPEIVTDASIDSLISKDLTKREILRKVEFCRENLDQLSKLDLEKISAENTEALKTIFATLKAHLKEMELAAQKVTD